jgi:aspartyl-tRNA(Asn)/glutamyl-tRNA(Gln) amidotransferase subunit C
MKINKKDADYAARLARLELSEEEKTKYAEQLGTILEYIDQLKKLDTKNVPPTSNVLALRNVWRQDKLRRCSPEEVEKLLANAPEREGNFFKVKKVIE